MTSGPNGRFTMTDRGRSALKQAADRIGIGPSSVTWTGRQLVIEVNEWGAPPMVTPVRGRVTLTPRALTQTEVWLTPDGAHLWRPFAPIADIEVDLTQGHRWRGHGYFDANFGSRALETDFSFWTWGLYPLKHRTLCFYDADLRDGGHFDLAVEITPDGQVRETTAPPRTRFRRNPWAVRRETRADPGTMPRPRLSLLEAPFYSRALVETQIEGERTVGMHEALDLGRFRSALIKPMLAVRVPRRARWT